MRTAIERKHNQVTEYVLTKYIHIFGAISEECMKRCLCAAVKADNLDLLRRLLDTRIHGGVQCIYVAFTLSCYHDLPTINRIVFDQRSLQLDKLVNMACPIETAIRMGSTRVVKDLLDIRTFLDRPRFLLHKH